MKVTLSSKIKENIKMVHLQTEEIYFKALESLLYLPRLTCRRADGCAFRPSEIKEYIEKRVKEREAVCDRHMW